MMKRHISALLAAMILSLAGPGYYGSSTADAVAPASSRFFSETKRTVQGRFLQYWEANGGLPQYGYPISDEMPEASEVDGKTYTVQYFERAVFELHTNQPPYDVLLSLLGSQRYLEYYGARGASNQRASTDNPLYVPETKRALGGAFRAYWETHGGLMQQGYPISDEFQEVSALDGKTYTVQYFERAVFELHPEEKGTPYEVLLTHLGTYQHMAKHGTLPIPGPSAPDLVQRYPAGSESYLVWSDVRVTAPRYPHDFPVYTVVAILALELRTNRVLTVTTSPDVLFRPLGISGSTVVWEERDNSCPNCHAKFVAKDLRTGTAVTVAEGEGIRQSPYIWGRTVVWVEGGRSEQHVMAKDLDTGTISIFASKPNTESLLLASPVISDQYATWVEVEIVSGSSFYKLQAADLRTRQVQTVAHAPGGAPPYANLDIFGSYLVWSDPSTKVVDLNTGKETFLTEEGAISAPKLRGNTFVWRSYSPDATSYQDHSLWGLKLSDLKPIHLGKIDTGYSGPTVAGDWIVWAGRERLSTRSVIQAFADAESAPPPPTPTPAPGGSQVVAVGAYSTPVGAGSSLFWIGGGSSNRIYRYDIDTQKATVFSEGPEYKLALASDGQDVVWIERLSNGLYRIQHYDPSTKQVSTVVQTQKSEDDYGVRKIATQRQAPPPMALDQGVLYYTSTATEHDGLWARSLATGEERLISPVGYGPVASDGHLMWTEQRKGGTQTGIEWSLHLRSKYSPDEDIVLARYMYSTDFTEYSVSGDNALWHSGGRVVNRYYIPSGAFTTIPLQYSFPKSRIYAPLVSGTRAVWTEVVDDQGLSWSIKARELDTGNTSTVVSEPDRTGKRVEAWAILVGRAVAYVTTVYGSPRPNVLQVVGLP